MGKAMNLKIQLLVMKERGFKLSEEMEFPILQKFWIPF